MKMNKMKANNNLELLMNKIKLKMAMKQQIVMNGNQIEDLYLKTNVLKKYGLEDMVLHNYQTQVGKCLQNQHLH